ncbi:hypothetical protein ACETRX_34710 [Labrys portucalensis]|uniref:Uncharacterized protein n=2 Tax=Labrys neptuniae TaxID=376174 RepID=A0ABV6ZRJ2_9HYPH
MRQAGTAPLHPLKLALLGALAVLAPPVNAKDLSDFERILPKSIAGMTQVKIHKTATDGQVIAFYGGKAGRATVFILPVSGEDAHGVTRTSQAVLLDATAAGLKEGTKALGDSYWTGSVQTHTLNADNIEMACTKVEMRQAGEKGPPDQMRLMDRRCFTQVGDVVIGTYVTTPFKESLRSALEKDQLIFCGAFTSAMVNEKR